MSEFIFDLQRFDSSGSGTGGGSNSGGSNAKTDGDAAVAASEVWKDGFATYTQSQKSAFADTAYTLLNSVAPTQYFATAGVDRFSVDGLVNNVIYGVDRFDSVNFNNLYLETFSSLNKYDDYVDLIFNTGTVTRLYTADDFTPTLNFVSGLNEVYCFPLNTWFTAEEAYVVAANFWPNCVVQKGSVDGDGNAVTTETFLASGSENNLITDVSWEDAINLYDTESTNSFFTQKTANGLMLVFGNGATSFVHYSGNFSPTFFMSDGSAYVYNSKKSAWQTYADAYADAVEYATQDLQTVLDKAAYDAEFNKVYDAEGTYVDADGTTKSWNYFSPFAVSRFENTLVYNAASTNDIYFTDALPANILAAIPDGDYYLNIWFDTGAVARIEYWSTVSPIFHFADGTTKAYNWATKEFADAYSGSYRDNPGAATDTQTDTNQANVTPTDTPTTPDTPTDPDMKPAEVITAGENNKRNQSVIAEKNNTTRSYEYDSTPFAISRANDSFINKVADDDDIWLVDATGENVTDFNIIGGYAISLDFDTGTNLRVQDASYISPVFHFADGTAMVYNWYTNQWVGAVDATEDVPQDFLVDAATNNFIRNAEFNDIVDITDATLDDVVKVDVNDYYVNLTFDTGASTAVRYTYNYSPVFRFADGSTYSYGLVYDASTRTYSGAWSNEAHASGAAVNLEAVTYECTDDFTDDHTISKATNNIVNNAGEEDILRFPDALIADTYVYPTDYYIDLFFDTGTLTEVWYTDGYSPLFIFADGNRMYNYYTGVWGRPWALDLNGAAENVTLSKYESNVMFYAENNDTVHFADANFTDLVSLGTADDHHINFTFDTGESTSVQFWSRLSPIFKFADGVNIGCDYTTGIIGTAYETVEDFNDTLSLSSAANNIVYDAEGDDEIYFTDATLANVAGYVEDNYYITITFDTGATTTVRYTDWYSPTLHFADGRSLAYSTSGDGFWINYFTGTDAADVFTMSGTVRNVVENVGAYDTIIFNDSTQANLSDFGFAINSADNDNRRFDLLFEPGDYTFVYYNANEGSTPTIVLADGTTYHYALYSGQDDVNDNFAISRNNDNIVFRTGFKDIINIVDAAIGNVTDFGMTDAYKTTLTFDNGTTTQIGIIDGISPVIAFTDGFLVYDGASKSWSTPYLATAAADTFNLSKENDNFIYYTDANDTIAIIDATWDNIVDPDFKETNATFTFDTGKTTAFTFENNVTPTLNLSGVSRRYHVFDPTDETGEIFSLSRNDYNIVGEYAGPYDYVIFNDATPGNLASVDVQDSTITFVFNTNSNTTTTTSVEYFDTLYGRSPEFTFSDGSIYRYNNSDTSAGETQVWQKYDATTDTWQTYGTDLVTSSTSESADLWGDTASDDLFGGGTIGTDATLTDLVAPVADVTSFNAGNAFDAQSAGEFVVVAADSSQKTA